MSDTVATTPKAATGVNGIDVHNAATVYACNGYIPSYLLGVVVWG